MEEMRKWKMKEGKKMSYKIEIGNSETKAEG